MVQHKAPHGQGSQQQLGRLADSATIGCGKGKAWLYLLTLKTKVSGKVNWSPLKALLSFTLQRQGEWKCCHCLNCRSEPTSTLDAADKGKQG